MLQVDALNNCTQQDLQDSQKAISALNAEQIQIRKVILQSRLALDILTALQGGTCAIIHTQCCTYIPVQFSRSVVSDSATPWTAARQASLSITNFQSSLKLMSIESVMPFNHLILCRPLLLLPSIFPSIRVFSNESALCIRWPKYWSFSFNISPSNEHSGLISFRMDLL